MPEENAQNHVKGSENVILKNPCFEDTVEVERRTIDEDLKVDNNKASIGLKNCSYLFYLSTSAALVGGALNFGISVGSMANTLALVKKEFRSSDLQMSVLVSGNPIGGLIGVLVAGFMADWLGRRTTMILNAVPFVVGSILMSTAKQLVPMVIGRVLVGIGVGVGSVVTNVFLSEVSPVSVRGGIGALYGVLLCVGTLLSFLLSMPQIMGQGELGWRLFFGLPIVTAVYQSFVLFFCPESPKYLALKKGDFKLAKKSLTKYRVSVEQSEEDALKQNLEESLGQKSKFVSLTELLSDSRLRLALAIGIGLNAGQQLSAINGILAYAPEIFSQAGVGDPSLATLLCGVSRIIGAVCGAVLVDRLGRRTIMWSGFLVLSVSCFLTAVSQICAGGVGSCKSQWNATLAIVAVLTFCFVISASASTIPWIIVAEIFPLEARGKGLSISVASHWIFHSLAVLFFDSVDDALQPYTFILFGGIMFVSFVAVVLFVPETKLKTVEQISEELRHQANKCLPIVF